MFKVNHKTPERRHRRRFYGEIKNNFYHFYRAFSCKKLSQT